MWREDFAASFALTICRSQNFLSIVRYSSASSLLYSLAAINKQKNVNTYKSYNYEYANLKAFDSKAATDARNAATAANGGGGGEAMAKNPMMGSSARKLAMLGGSMRRMDMKKSRAQSVYIRGI